MDWAEKEIASLELSKKLKELGFPQKEPGWFWCLRKDSEFYDLFFTMDKMYFYKPKQYEEFFIFEYHHLQDYIKAPTNSELGEWLPPYWISWRDKKGRYWISRIREFKCVFNSEDYPELSRPIAVAIENFINREYTPTNNEANARAKLLIFLREAGYITFKQGDKDNAQP